MASAIPCNGTKTSNKAYLNRKPCYLHQQVQQKATMRKVAPPTPPSYVYFHFSTSKKIKPRESRKSGHTHTYPYPCKNKKRRGYKYTPHLSLRNHCTARRTTTPPTRRSFPRPHRPCRGRSRTGPLRSLLRHRTKTVKQTKRGTRTGTTVQFIIIVRTRAKNPRHSKNRQHRC